MERCLLSLRRTRPVLVAVLQKPLVKPHTLVCSAVFISTRHKHSDGQGFDKDTLDDTQTGQDKVAVKKWTPRRRSSLSPSARLLAAMSEDSRGFQHSSAVLETENCSLGVKTHETGDHNDGSARCEPAEGGNQGKHTKGVRSDPRLRRKHLSPLTRFTELIPEKYWDEENVSSAVKQDLRDLMKSDDALKKQ